ncbi:BRO1 domain-containing protein [Gongronella butleri]|nr:BRO1 domain-containing protein [Gongronella butleri]
MSYQFSLPTTGAVSFGDFFEGGYTSELSDASAQRGRLRTVLKGLKKESQDARDLTGVINTIDDYLPYLLAIVNCLESDELQIKTTAFETSWRSTLSDHIIHTGSNAPRIIGAGIHYELIFVLLTYAYATSLQGSEYVHAIQQIQADSTAPAMTYNKAADALNTAAGIFLYVADQVIPKAQHAKKDAPVETLRDVAVALSKMTLADAQSVAINKALCHGNLSKSLAAKLYLGVAGQYEMAYGLISSVKEVTSELKKYLLDGTLFYKAMAKKYLALDAHDNQKMGVAVGFLRECKADLKSVQQLSLSKPHQMRKSTAVAARALKEEESVNDLLQRFNLINDTVSYQSVPTRQDLQRMIPSGRSVLEMKPYIPPSPIFGKVSNFGGQEDASYARSGRYW